MRRWSSRLVWIVPLVAVAAGGLHHYAKERRTAEVRENGARANEELRRRLAESRGSGFPADAGLVVAAPARRPIALSATRAQPDPGAENGSVAGFVVGQASGRAVPGAELTFAHEGTTRAVRADADGFFFYAPGEAGEHELALATAEGFLPFAPEWGHSPIRLHLRPRVRLSDVRITLVEATPTIVSVVGEDGAPVEGATVRAHGLERGERALSPLDDTWTSDARGEVRAVLPEDALVEAAHEAHGRGRARYDAPAQAARRLRVTLAPIATAVATLSGRVLDPDGRPVEGAWVVARHRVEAGVDLHPVVEAQTDADGAFRVAGVDEGAYRVIATADGFARGITDGSTAAPVTVHLAPEGRVRVRVLDADGAPVIASSVVVERARGALEAESLALVAGYDASGEVEIDGLPLGPVRVTATSPGFAPATVEAHPAKRAPIVEVRLGRGGGIRGTVVSAEGEAPLHRARVSLEGRLGTGASAVPLQVSAETDGGGRFTLDGVPPGTAAVIVFAEDHHGRLRAGIVVTEGAVTDVGAIDLAPVAEGDAPGVELAGIGAILAAEGDVLLVREVVEGGGASEAGLAPGDAILAIDDVPVDTLGFEGCVARIRGPEGTSVTLLVRRAGVDEATPIAVPRRRVRA